MAVNSRLLLYFSFAMYKKKIILIIFVACIAILLTLIYQNIIFVDHKLHVTFCDVGQGDAIFIRTPQGSDILVDGGPDNSVLNCLSKRMPFWDRTIELVILTHPHADHLNGLISVAKNYKIVSFATENLSNTTQGFSLLVDLIKKEGVRIRHVYANDKFKLRDGVVLEIVGPTKEFLGFTSPQGLIGESSEFGSLLTLVKYEKFSVLLTGDSQAEELSEAVRTSLFAKGISVLQVPHHGSRTGLTSEILDILNPKLAVISVGKNSYGHPTAFILDLLKTLNIKTLRTDLDGEVEVVSDGNTFKVQ